MAALFAMDDLFLKAFDALDGRRWTPRTGTPNRPATSEELGLRDLCAQALTDHDLAAEGEAVSGDDLHSAVRVVWRAAVASRRRGAAGFPILSAVAEHLDRMTAGAATT
jgi:hypothetical protein